MKGEKLKGALAKAPREKAMERLSPGVYRGSRGGLVGQGGQAVRRPQPQNPQMMTDAVSGMRQPAPLQTEASPEQVTQMIAGQPMQRGPVPMQQYTPAYMMSRPGIPWWAQQNLPQQNMPYNAPQIMVPATQQPMPQPLQQVKK